MKTKPLHIFVIGTILLYLLIPLAATVIYSIATQWNTTILPEGYTLSAYKTLFADERFQEALLRSLYISSISVFISVALTLVGVYINTLYFPRWEKVFDALAILPFALPGVVLSVGLIQLYNSGPIPIAGTQYVLIGGYFTISLPFIYQAIKNSMKSVDAISLVQAAESLGAGKFKAFTLVILPSVLPGVTIAGLLAFSFVFGDFVIANLLVGGSFETIQVYLMDILKKDGHLASALVVLYYSVVLALSGFIIWIPVLIKKWSRKKRESKMRKGESGYELYQADESF